MAQADTLLAEEYDDLGYAADIAVGEDAAIYIADYLNGTIHILSNGRAVRTFGKKGAGPNELINPVVISAGKEEVWVGDSGKGMIAKLDSTGRHVFTISGITGRPAAVNREGKYALVSSEEEDGKLVSIGFNGAIVGRIGEKLAKNASVYDFTEMKRQAADREIPPILLNNVRPYVNDAGGVWVVYDAAGLVVRYLNDNTKACEVKLRAPAVEQIKNDFYSRNMRESEPARFFTLSLVSDAYPAGDSLYVLYNTPDNMDAVIDVLGRDCRYIRRFELRDIKAARSLGVTPDQQNLIIAIPQNSEIIMVRVSGSGNRGN